MSLRTSLSLRLAVSSAVWVAGALLATGLLIVFLFKGHIERRFDHLLANHLEELVAASEIDPVSGKLTLTWTPADPRFNRPHSGWYWQIMTNDLVVGQSKSIWTAKLLPEKGAPAPAPTRAIGPSGRELRLYIRTIRLPRGTSPFIFVIAGPLSDIAGDVREFAGNVALVLSLLAILLIGLIVLQVGYGLLPLRRVSRALADIRGGRRDRLPGDFPAEVQPLARELNALLDYNSALLERARTQVGNLAHALKNPLAVLANEAKGVKGEAGRIMSKQLNAATESVERYLQRARIAGSGNVLSARAGLESTVRDIGFSLEILYRERGLRMIFEDLEGVTLRLDAEDLEEVLGNLMDNACKWAAGIVRVTARLEEGRAVILVEDDGPGIPDEHLEKIKKRGFRLDERESGAGLGLSIVREVLELSNGRLALGASSLGGLCAKVDLPAQHEKS